MNLFIDSISSEATENDLRELFSKYEPSSVKILKDWNTGRSRGKGFVEIPDDVMAWKAIKELNGISLLGSQILVEKARERSAKNKSKQHHRPSHNTQHHSTVGAAAQHGNTKSPYNFKKRELDKKDKKVLYQFHNILLDKHYDIAFDISWQTLTETAPNPVVDPNVDETCPKNDKNEFQGYNKRWLTIDGKLAISSFTVKSAIANGFANILGGCYRVNTKTEGHSDIGQGKYPYGGKYKRYRVDMGNSYPGIVEEIEEHDNGDKTFTIQPVDEYYYDNKSVGILQPGDIIKVDKDDVQEKNHKKFLKKVTGTKGSIEIIYYGPYRFGMNLGLKPGELSKNHYHRFYNKKDINKKLFSPIKIRVAAINFKDKKALGQEVYMGVFRRLPPAQINKNVFDTQILIKLKSAKEKKQIQNFYYLDRIKPIYKLSRNIGEKEEKQIFQIFKSAKYDYDPREKEDGKFWIENLDNVKVKSFVYYQQYAGGSGNIGQNFQFKALFLHEDTIPAGQETCTDLKELCPRCRMFGLVAKEQNKDKGFKGRFKSSTLVNTSVLKEGPPLCPPQYEFMTEKIELKQWMDNSGNRIARQVLLPILGEPKPNKRDKNGYYKTVNPADEDYCEKEAGDVKGAKYYQHAKTDLNNLIGRTNRKNPDEYSHKLRNYAQVCEAGLTFNGTVGAENCNLDEIGALLVLLHSELLNNGFKIGLGKSLGLGSIKSTVTKVWIRKPDEYEKWLPIPLDADTNIINILKDALPGIDEKIKNLKKSAKVLNSLKVKNDDLTVPDYTLEFPGPDPMELKHYWRTFNNNKVE